MKKHIPLELLAPARTCKTGRLAILHGADAVYIGGPSHGARASASNSIEDIRELCEFAHQFRARVYVTLNTIIFDSELEEVRNTVMRLYRAGVDALIVQDMALLRMEIPPIALHASTQCDTRTPEKAKFLAECGFSQIVIARECSEEEVRAIRAAIPADVSIEAFVHGALCVSYSGDCQASYCTSGRSANRGNCAQMCRLAYDLTDAQGNVLIANRHLLSLRDLNRMEHIERMAMSGVSSFKIEGRLKDDAYVKTVVAAYRREIDRVIATHPDRFIRASQGRSQVSFTPDVTKVFNRRFTPYFFDPDKVSGRGMAEFSTPKWIGQPVGVVKSNLGKCITLFAPAQISNGDGLGYFNSKGMYTGFRVNRVDGYKLYPARAVDVAPGDSLYRNSSTEFEAAMAQETATRKLELKMTLRLSASDRISLRCKTEGGSHVEISKEIVPSTAKSPQGEVRSRNFGKLGGTIYTLTEYEDTLPDDLFIPASELSALRRDALNALERQRRATYRFDYRRSENKDAPYVNSSLTYHDNVANSLAEQFYREHGAKEIARAIECTPPTLIPADTTVMTTRYCLRRELGACLRTPEGKKLPSVLYLTNGNIRFRLDFDCKRCQMIVKKT